jgi:hypothetical protein
VALEHDEQFLLDVHTCFCEGYCGKDGMPPDQRPGVAVSEIRHVIQMQRSGNRIVLEHRTVARETGMQCLLERRRGEVGTDVGVLLFFQTRRMNAHAPQHAGGADAALNQLLIERAPTAIAPTVLAIQHLKVSYGITQVLRDVTFEVPAGKVRGVEALDLLKAWGTGHPGGIGTLHAGSAMGALRRLEQLIQEAVVAVPRALIAETIELIAVLSGRGAVRTGMTRAVS